MNRFLVKVRNLPDSVFLILTVTPDTPFFTHKRIYDTCLFCILFLPFILAVIDV